MLWLSLLMPGRFHASDRRFRVKVWRSVGDRLGVNAEAAAVCAEPSAVFV